MQKFSLSLPDFPWVSYETALSNCHPMKLETNAIQLCLLVPVCDITYPLNKLASENLFFLRVVWVLLCLRCSGLGLKKANTGSLWAKRSSSNTNCKHVKTFCFIEILLFWGKLVTYQSGVCLKSRQKKKLKSIWTDSNPSQTQTFMNSDLNLDLAFRFIIRSLYQSKNDWPN